MQHGDSYRAFIIEHRVKHFQHDFLLLAYFSFDISVMYETTTTTWIINFLDMALLHTTLYNKRSLSTVFYCLMVLFRTIFSAFHQSGFTCWCIENVYSMFPIS
ncbi:hypothetical protein FKM82_008493 [Ascaphus truei]